MEVDGCSQPEQSYLINELTQGMARAMQLRGQMGPEYSAETKEMLLEQIVSSYNKALYVLRNGAPAGQPHQLAPVVPSSPSSIVENPKGDDVSMRSNTHQDAKGYSLKRKSAPTWTKQVKLNPENGLDGPPEDGHSWRKYGQKDILGAKYPRSYYRCTYRSVQDCWATRQVQRSDNDPTVFDITYKGKHTCSVVRRSKSAPTSPAKQDLNQEIISTIQHQQDPTLALNFQTPLQSNNAEIPAFSSSNLNNNFYGNLSASLVSPSTSGSNYFSMSPCELDTFANVQHQQLNFGGESGDIADMFLAATSTANSPTIDPDFSLDGWTFNQNFPSRDPGFFS